MKLAYRETFEKEFDFSLKTGLAVVQDFPQSAKALLAIAARQPKAQKSRDKWADNGVVVPPLLIVSTTDACNLHCKGCYSAANSCKTSKNEMTRTQIDVLLTQAVDAGCSAVLLAGGEPLLCQDWLDAVAAHPQLLGLVFTNGTLFDSNWVNWFSKNRNMVPLFSIEGNSENTDNRRGDGVFDKISTAMQLLNNAHIPFGVSITTGGHNMKLVASQDFIAPYISLGCRLVIHVEYVPVSESDELYILSEEEKQQLDAYCRSETKNGKALIFAFPGDEEMFGGCLAAGRGFVHINASGSLEPCPFAPYSDVNVCDLSLIDALKSPLLSSIRENSTMLHEGGGGCALRNKGAWMEEMLNTVK